MRETAPNIWTYLNDMNGKMDRTKFTSDAVWERRCSSDITGIHLSIHFLFPGCSDQKEGTRVTGYISDYKVTLWTVCIFSYRKSMRNKQQGLRASYPEGAAGDGGARGDAETDVSGDLRELIGLVEQGTNVGVSSKHNCWPE